MHRGNLAALRGPRSERGAEVLRFAEQSLYCSVEPFQSVAGFRRLGFRVHSLGGLRGARLGDNRSFEGSLKLQHNESVNVAPPPAPLLTRGSVPRLEVCTSGAANSYASALKFLRGNRGYPRARDFSLTPSFVEYCLVRFHTRSFLARGQPTCLSSRLHR